MWKKLRVLWVLAAVLALVALRWATGDLTLHGVIATLESVRERWWALPAFLGAYVVLTTAFCPAVVFHMAAGVTWGFGAAVALNFLAFNGTASLQFWVARRLGRERIARLLSGSRLLRLDQGASRHGLRAMLAIRAFPLPAMLVAVSAGVSAVRWRDFALGTAIGAAPYVIIYTYFASAIAEGVAGAQRRALIQGGAAALIILLLAVVPRLWARKRKLPVEAQEPSGSS